jgi:hypothetical protein
MKPTRRNALPQNTALYSSSPTTMFKRQFAILPFDLPRLSDKAAAQLLEVLHQIVEGIDYHYAEQAHRYRQRQQEIAYMRRAPASNLSDPPF